MLLTTTKSYLSSMKPRYVHIYPPMKTFSQQTTPVPTQAYLTHLPVTEAPHLPIQVHLAHLHIY